MTADQFRQLLEQNNARLIERIDARLEEKNAALFGQLSQYFDKRFETLDTKLDAGLNRIYTTLDGITERLDSDEKERAAINAEQERQNGWIGQLAKATNTKLVPEQ
jgi:hypothetical protein